MVMGAGAACGKDKRSHKLSACSGDTEKTIATLYPQLPLLLRVVECLPRSRRRSRCTLEFRAD